MAESAPQDAKKPRIEQTEEVPKEPVKLICEETLKGIIRWCLKNTQIKKPLKPSKKRKDTLLHYVAENGYLHVAQVLFEENDFDVNSLGEEGETPLQIAVEKKHDKLAVFLMEKGADTTAINEYNETLLNTAIMNDLSETAKILIEKGADVNAKYSRPLHSAIDNSNFELVKLLVEKGCDVNTKDINGNTPLNRLCKTYPNQVTEAEGQIDKNSVKIAELLIENGAEINVRNKVGKTPLIYAFRIGLACKENDASKYDLARLLLSKGADANATLLQAFKENYNLEILKVLVEHSADVNVSFSSETETNLLHSAIKKGDIDMVKFLIEAGATLQPTSYNIRQTLCQSSPLHIAARDGNVDIAKLLLEKGCDINCLETRISENNYWSQVSSSEVDNTALHIAAKEGKLKFVKFLLKNGADATLKNGKGKTPKEIAIRNGNIELIDLFYNHKKANNSEKSKTKLDDCIICFNLRREIFAFDCGYDRHAKLCETCCLKILTENHPKCPVCRRDVTKYSKIFV